MAGKIENLFAASRFVLPEQREAYLRHREEASLQPMPVLEQDELESFHYLIRDAGREDYALSVTWWKPVKGELGMTATMSGKVAWVDPASRRLKLVDETGEQWIPLDRIVAVRAD